MCTSKYGHYEIWDDKTVLMYDGVGKKLEVEEHLFNCIMYLYIQVDIIMVA